MSKLKDRVNRAEKALTENGWTYKEGADDFIVDKAPGLEHWIDGCGYLILSAMNQVKPWKTGRAKSKVGQVW